MRSVALALALTLGLVLGTWGCSAARNHSGQPSSGRPSPQGSSVPSSPHVRTHGSVLPSKVLVVIEENHSLEERRAGMPFLASASERYGYATDWHALAHPSEPNYLGIAGGSTFGVTDDGPPADNAPSVGDAQSLFSLALHAGRSAGTFAESMGEPCSLADSYPYAVRHNPWTYFSAQRDACRAHDLDAESFSRTASSDALPNVGFLIPDLRHDAHDGSLQAADDWLRAELTPVLASEDFRSGRLAVVVTADEDDRHAGNTVLTSVLDSRLSSVVVSTPLTHYSLTRFIAQVLGVAAPGEARNAPDLASAFGLAPAPGM